MLLTATSFPPEQPRTGSDSPRVKPVLAEVRLRPIFIATFVLSFALNLFFFTYPLSWTEIGFDKATLESLFDYFLAQRLIRLPLHAAGGESRTVSPADHDRLA